MMQEILLFGQVTAGHRQTLRQQLAGITRMQPQPMLERHIIFKPVPPVGLTNLGGSTSSGAQQQDLQKTRQLLNAPSNYVQLVGVAENRGAVSPTDRQGAPQNGTADQDVVMTDTENHSPEYPNALHWYLEYRDIPEPGKVTTTSRAISRTHVLDGDPYQFMVRLGYEYLSQYIIVGDRFYDKDTILSLYNVMQVPEHALDATGPNFHSINTLPDVTKLTALDPNGSFVLQASIEIADGGNPELKDKAAQQLLAMKETMRGSVILAPGDRLALDTRVPVRRVR